MGLPFLPGARGGRCSSFAACRPRSLLSPLLSSRRCFHFLAEFPLKLILPWALCNLLFFSVMILSFSPLSFLRLVHTFLSLFWVHFQFSFVFLIPGVFASPPCLFECVCLRLRCRLVILCGFATPSGAEGLFLAWDVCIFADLFTAALQGLELPLACPHGVGMGRIPSFTAPSSVCPAKSGARGPPCLASGSEGPASPLSQRFCLPLSPLPLYPVAKATCPLGFPFSLQKQSLTSALQPGPVGRCFQGFSLEGFWPPAPPPAPPTPAGPGVCNCALWTGHQAVR